MARQPTTRLQVSGYDSVSPDGARAAARRHPDAARSDAGTVALAHRGLRSGDRRRRSMRDPRVPPAERPMGDAAIVMSRESGALYVRVGDTLHPVLNLASARLVTGSAANPRVVNESNTDGAPAWTRSSGPPCRCAGSAGCWPTWSAGQGEETVYGPDVREALSDLLRDVADAVEAYGEPGRLGGRRARARGRAAARGAGRRVGGPAPAGRAAAARGAAWPATSGSCTGS